MKKVLILLFTVLYVAVGFVSTYHAIDFFSIANTSWLAVILACTFEIGQAAVLFTLLVRSGKGKAYMPYILMVMLTIVQTTGNIFASYKFMALHSATEVKYFTDSVLFFIADPDPQVNFVIISYMIGAILPIVALCMTGMVVDIAKSMHGDDDEEKKDDMPVIYINDEEPEINEDEIEVPDMEEEEPEKVESEMEPEPSEINTEESEK